VSAVIWHGDCFKATELTLRAENSNPRSRSAGRVLLVDDQPELRRFLARYLTRIGFEVLEAHDGVAGLELLHQHRVDAVLSDIRMPRMGGLALLEALLNLDPNLPLVLMSGSDEVQDAETARQLGAFDFLPKPINLMRLISAMTRAVERRRSQRDLGQPRAGTILVVDDYDDARGVLRDALEGLGHAVVEAANGQQALDCLVSRRQQTFDLITLDLMMPVMDGFKFLELLRSYVRLSTIPVLVVSSHAETVSKDAHSAIVGRVQAPYRLSELVQLVSGCLAAPTSNG
jgi:CheY-like chemotaxis protein